MTKYSNSSWSDIETVEPDEFDIKMLESIKNDPDCSEFISSEEAMNEIGLNQDRKKV